MHGGVAKLTANFTRTPMSPLVSVIVRSMARPSLADALASIGAQVYPHVEAVVVAACGTAHPRPLATVGAHPVRFVEGEAPRTRPQAANAGLDAASGDFLTFLDDDDVMRPRHVAGLVEALGNAGDAKLVYTLARASFSDGSEQSVGQPFSLHEIYERNFIHLSMALFSRELMALGCRFDESLDILQDWDFFIQCAQHTRFHFEPRQTFEWRADAGTSGAGGGINQNDARFALYRDRVYAKWAERFDALVDRVGGMLGDASARAKDGDYLNAEAICREVLAASQNDPFALNLLAMIERATGRIDEARVTQTLACAVRPGDKSLAHNLALLGAPHASSEQEGLSNART